MNKKRLALLTILIGSRSLCAAQGGVTSADDERVLPLHGGFSSPVGEFSDPITPGGSPALAGSAFGIELGFCAAENIRWLTSGLISVNPLTPMKEFQGEAYSADPSPIVSSGF